MLKPIWQSHFPRETKRHFQIGIKTTKIKLHYAVRSLYYSVISIFFECFKNLKLALLKHFSIFRVSILLKKMINYFPLKEVF